jgi:hypothetical protein
VTLCKAVKRQPRTLENCSRMPAIHSRSVHARSPIGHRSAGPVSVTGREKP